MPPLADAVDRTLDLPCPGHDGRQGIGDRHTQIVVGMRAHDRLVDISNMLFEVGKGPAILGRNGEADGVGNIHRGSARFNRTLNDLDEEIEFGSGSVFGRELDVVAEFPGASNALDGATDDFVLGHHEFEFTVNGAGCQKDMDAAPAGVANGFGSAIDVGTITAREAADYRPFYLAGDGLYRLKVAGRSDGETRLDDIDAEVAKGVGNFELFGQVHAGARGLFAIAKSGVEDQNAAVVGHDKTPSKRKSPGTFRPGAIVSKLVLGAG
jgi:hypothetical protein